MIITWQRSLLQALMPISPIAWLLVIVQTTFTTGLSAVLQPLLPRGSALVSSIRFVVQSIGVAVLVAQVGW